MSDRIAEALKRLDSDIQLSLEITKRHTSIPEKRLKDMFGRAPTPTIFTPEEAKAVGIVDNVIELNSSGQAQSNVAVWTVGW